MTDNLILNKSFSFAVDTINIYKGLCSKNEYVLSKQLLRSGTSVGANVREALDGQSKKDFLSKMNIALKEVKEVEYWIELLLETSYLTIDDHGWYLDKCKEICRILNAIVKSTKKSLGL
jgi:four helix bundle protein